MCPVSWAKGFQEAAGHVCQQGPQKPEGRALRTHGARGCRLQAGTAELELESAQASSHMDQEHGPDLCRQALPSLLCQVRRPLVNVIRGNRLLPRHYSHTQSAFLVSRKAPVHHFRFYRRLWDYLCPSLQHEVNVQEHKGDFSH